MAERLARTVRDQGLDHLIVLNEQHLRPVLTEVAAHYDQERPHRTLALETPTPVPRTIAGRICSRPILGGLHHAYRRAA